MFGNIGFPELLVILTIALLIFGPRKLPEIGRSIGKAMREFRRTSDEIKEKIEEEIQAEEFKDIKEEIDKDIKRQIGSLTPSNKEYIGEELLSLKNEKPALEGSLKCSHRCPNPEAVIKLLIDKIMTGIRKFVEKIELDPEEKRALIHINKFPAASQPGILL